MNWTPDFEGLLDGRRRTPANEDSWQSVECNPDRRAEDRAVGGGYGLTEQEYRAEHPRIPERRINPGDLDADRRQGEHYSGGPGRRNLDRNGVLEDRMVEKDNSPRRM